MTYKCIIFDFDGTLADSENAMVEIYNKLALKYGYKTITSSDVENFKSMPITSILSNLQIPYKKMFPLLKEGQKIFLTYSNYIKPYEEELKEILETLKNNTTHMGIISSNSKVNIKNFLKNHNIEFMDFIISSPLFSKEFKIQKILKKYKLNPSEVLYIGDEARDIVSSKKAKIKTCGVSWGYNTTEMLNKEEPDYLINTLSELIEISK